MNAKRSIRHGELTLPLPEGWFDASQVVAVGPEEGGFRRSLVVSVEPVAPEETVQGYAARILPAVQRTGPGFALVSEQEVGYAGGLSGVLREYTFDLNGLRVAQLQLYTVKDGVARTFTYTQRADRLEATRSEAEHFFSSARMGGMAEALRAPGTIRG